MSIFKTLCTAATLALAVPVAGQAASLAFISFDYGAGKDTPFGDDPVLADSIRVKDTNITTGYAQFAEVFNFGDLTGSTITSIEVTLNYKRVSVAQPDPNDPLDETGEIWWARIQGSDDNTLDDDYFLELPGTGPNTGTLAFTLDASDDLTSISDRPDDISTTNSAFATSVADNRVVLRFREETAGDDNFELLGATVEVFGTPPAVPLPASGLLLLGAMGGMAAWKRRKVS